MANKKNPTPAPAPVKPASRKDLLAALNERGYAGPTSFTASKLRDVAEWLEAGGSKDDTNIPANVRFSVYPELKPVSKAKAARLTRFDQGFQGALAEVAELSDLASVKKWVAENRVQVEA